MKLTIMIGTIIIIMFIIMFGLLNMANEEKGKMKITSVFEQGERIPSRYTADGDDVNPSLKIQGIPSQSKSLVLIVDDPDAPNGDWVHWIVLNIPVTGSELIIEENTIPLGITEKNSWGKNEYRGPSPPSRVHRYFFKVYALNNNLDLGTSVEKKEVLNAMEGNVIEKTELIGTYSRD